MVALDREGRRLGARAAVRLLAGPPGETSTSTRAASSVSTQTVACVSPT